MSNHYVGRAGSSVVKVVLVKLDSGEISVDTARELLNACRMSVNWCDGNECEAMIPMHQMMCGYCLKKLHECDTIYNIYDLEPAFKSAHQNEIWALDDRIADCFLCGECFDKLLDEMASGAGAEQRKYIEENKPEHYWHYNDWRRLFEIFD